MMQNDDRNRIRIWVFEEDGSANYTFGWNNVSFTQTCILLGLDGVAATVLAVASPILNVKTDTAFPTISVQSGDLVVPVAVGQTTDEMTAGPAGYTEEFNNTGTVASRSGAVFSAIADAATITPGNPTWDGSVGAHTQTVLAFRP